MRTTHCLAIAALVLAAAVAPAVEPPQPYGPVPSARQLQWHEMEFYGFLHFTVNTFTDKEWGYGDEAESVFNPSDFNAEQIVSTAAAAGMKGLILTCKHHDGFCLWPSKYTEHSVKNSPWLGGKGDVVKAISDACRKHGLKFGTYLSPWDRNFKDYGRPEYLVYYRNQLRELMKNYGPVFEVWFDGANGGDGYYGGARERRGINGRTYYDWPNTWQIVRDLQPGACLFSDAGPDVRWVGNEHGSAGTTCWATLNRDDFAPGIADTGRLNRGDRPGTHWLPAEVDVSIRPGWFYHAREDDRVRSPENLVNLYYQSVGRGASLLLNIPPDRRGRLHDNDVKSLEGFGKIIKETFKTDLARGAKAEASNVRGKERRFAAAHALDGDRDTYWCTDDGIATPELLLDTGKPVTFNVISLREYLPLGQRIEEWAADAWTDGRWVEIAKGTSIGSRCLWRGDDVTTGKVRLRIVKAAACPALSEFALYRAPALNGAANPGTQTVKGLDKSKWLAMATSYGAPDSGQSERAIDNNPKTLWHTHGPDGEHPPPHFIAINLGGEANVTGFTYLPRSDGTTRGIVDQYAVYTSADGENWGVPAAEGEFSNIKANPIQQVVNFAKPVNARFIKFVAKHSADGNHISVAEIGVLGSYVAKP